MRDDYFSDRSLHLLRVLTNEQHSHFTILYRPIEQTVLGLFIEGSGDTHVLQIHKIAHSALFA